MTTGLIISAPTIAKAQFSLVGIAPLMTARFSKKAEIMAAQAEGSRSKSKRTRKERDFESEWLDAAYRSPEGWFGVNASAFRNASISACRLVGFKMTVAKLSVFVQADGFDADDSLPLVRITKGEPKASYLRVRNATGVIDIRSRPLWEPGWEMQPVMQWDAAQFSLEDITNLIARVGLQVGIGEGRPDSRESAGLGYGLFEVRDVTILTRA